MSKSDEEIVEEIREKIRNPSKEFSTERAPPNLDWRNQDEVKSYLDNLFVEYNFECYSERKPDGCHRLANYLENITGRYQEATELYKQNCDDFKYPRSCLTYSKNKSLGRGCKQDLLEACKYSFLSCDLDMNEGCLNAGICLTEGVGGLPKDTTEGIKYLEKSCDAKNPIACVKLFKLYVDGKNNRPPRDPVKAFGYAKQACDYNDILGCLNASLMCRKGEGIPKDEKLAEEFRKRAENLKREMDSFREHQQIVFGEQHK